MGEIHVMPERLDSRPRVLLGAFDSLARIGLRELANERGAAVVGEHDRSEVIVHEAARLRPDLVVLPLDGSPSRVLGARVRAAAPAARLLYWPREEDAVELQERGRCIRQRVTAAVLDALASELCRTSEYPPSEGERCRPT